MREEAIALATFILSLLIGTLVYLYFSRTVVAIAIIGAYALSLSTNIAVLLWRKYER